MNVTEALLFFDWLDSVRYGYRYVKLPRVCREMDAELTQVTSEARKFNLRQNLFLSFWNSRIVAITHHTQISALCILSLLLRLK
jgi:hypothetical protein